MLRDIVTTVLDDGRMQEGEQEMLDVVRNIVTTVLDDGRMQEGVGVQEMLDVALGYDRAQPFAVALCDAISLEVLQRSLHPRP